MKGEDSEGSGGLAVRVFSAQDGVLIKEESRCSFFMLCKLREDDMSLFTIAMRS